MHVYTARDDMRKEGIRHGMREATDDVDWPTRIGAVAQAPGESGLPGGGSAAATFRQA